MSGDVRGWAYGRDWDGDVDRAQCFQYLITEPLWGSPSLQLKPLLLDS